MLGKILLLLVLIQTTICDLINDGQVDYSQHKIVKISPKNVQHLEELKKIKSNFGPKVDFWGAPMPDLRPILTLIGPEEGNEFLLALNNSQLKYEIIANSFQKVIDSEREENERSSLYFADSFDYENQYHNYSEIVAQFNSISSQNPKATYKSIGKTYEGRDIPSLIVTNPNGTDKPTIFLECGIHAKEWISTAACLYMANQLLTDPENDHFLTKYEFIIVPVLNADGYVYTWERDRNWRKTRSPNAGTNCYGTDPNRNWDTAWSKEGAATDPCDETYCGSKPFSEVEVKQFSKLIATRKGRIAAYFALHSSKELWMYPWGYTYTLPPNAEQLDLLSTEAVKAIKEAHGLTFNKGNIAKIIYLASGSSIDWVYDKSDGKVAFGVELRDKGSYGVLLPPNQIKPACEETWAGVRTVISLL